MCSRWYRAADHFADLLAFVQHWVGPPCYYALDMFGASEVIAKAWRGKGFGAVAYDILLDGKCPHLSNALVHFYFVP